jgi:DNA-binding XRE family transcriptional regulator
MDANSKESVLVSLRKELDLTQKQIADALAVTEQTVRNWEQGKSIPKLTIPQMKILCKLLQRPIEAIPDNFGPIEQSAETAPNSPSASNSDDLN